MVRPKSAARKFAHRPPIIPPKTPPAVIERRPPPPSRNHGSVSNPVQVAHFVDTVCYKNLHYHVKNGVKGTLKEMRLVLERYSPEHEQPERPENDLEIIQQQEDVRGPPLTPKVHPIKKKSKNLRPRITPKLHVPRDSASIAESVEVNNLKIIQLRNRQIVRPWQFSAKLRRKQRARRVVSRGIRTSASSESVDDNRPLTYFINKNLDKQRTRKQNLTGPSNRKSLLRKADTEPVPGTSRVIINPRLRSHSPSNSLLVPLPPKGSNKNHLKRKATQKVPQKILPTPKRGRKERPRVVTPPVHEDMDMVWITDSDEHEMDAESMAWDPSINGDTPNRISPCIEGVSSLPKHSRVQPRKQTGPPSVHYASSVTTELQHLLPVQKPSDSLSDFVIRLLNFNQQLQDSDSVMANTGSPPGSHWITPWFTLDQGFLRGDHQASPSVITIHDDESIAGGSVICEELEPEQPGMSRVHQWLAEVDARQRGIIPTTSVFKVPDMPLWRLTQAPSEGSVRSVNQGPLSATEEMLRRRCTAWSYTKLSNIQFDPSLIKEFCTECTRCKLMFKNVSSVSASTCNGPSGSMSDVYEFNVEQDDNPGTDPIAPYRNARTDETHENNMNFKNRLIMISEDPEYFQKLKEHMTKIGKKICHVAHLIKFKLREGVEIAPRNSILIGQVISTLVESNKGPQPQVNQQCSTSTQKTPRATPAEGSSRPKTKKQTSSQSVRSGSMRPVIDTMRNKLRAKQGLLKKAKRFMATEGDFAQSPVKFCTRLMQNYPGLGICGIKCPLCFDPLCTIDESTSFKSVCQYVHRYLERFSMPTKEFIAITAAHGKFAHTSPLLAGLEVDLVRLCTTVQEENGIEAVNSDDENWEIIKQKMELCYSGKAEAKLRNIYFKYILPYQTLLPEHRSALIMSVDACCKKRQEMAKERARDPLYRQKRMMERCADYEELTRVESACAETEDCCIPNTRSSSLRDFKKTAKQAQNTHFPEEPPSVEEVEMKFWEIIMNASQHVCVNAASVDTTENGLGFEADRGKPYGDHPWNLKRLGLSSWNLLSYLGPTTGASSTTLLFGMVFSASCWHMDPTKVPYIEYLHQGPPKIWYTISYNQNEKFRQTVEELCPHAVLNKQIWLPSDMTLIPPALLIEHGVEVTRHIQNVGEYVVIYPNTYYASINTGYTISEGAYFAPHEWINTAESIHLNLQNDCEPSLFSMHKLLIAIAKDPNASLSLVQRVNSVLVGLLRSEMSYRARLIKNNIELITPETFQKQNKRKSWAWQLRENGECAYCRTNTVLSRIIGLTGGSTALCAMHGMHLYNQARKNGIKSNVYGIVLMSNEEIEEILSNLRRRVRDATANIICPGFDDY